MGLYRLSEVLHSRIIAVMTEAGIPYESRMSICSKVTGKTIYKWNDLTELDAIHIIDYITKDTENKRANKNRGKTRRFKTGNSAGRFDGA